MSAVPPALVSPPQPAFVAALIVSKSSSSPRTAPITSFAAAGLNYLPDCRFVSDRPTSCRGDARRINCKDTLSSSEHKEQSHYCSDSFGHKFTPFLFIGLILLGVNFRRGTDSLIQ